MVNVLGDTLHFCSSCRFGLVVGEYSTLREVLNLEKYRGINIDGEVLEM